MANTQLVALGDVRGPLDDFFGKLESRDGAVWLGAFKRFLRKEDPWEQSAPPSLFVSPEQQRENVRRWNEEYNLDFTEADFEKLGLPPTTGYGFVQWVLVPYLDDLKTKERTIGGIERTFEVLWQIVVAQQPDTYRWFAVQLDPKHLRCLEGITHPGKCLQWERIDLAANRNKQPKDVRGPKTSPHAGILAAVAHFPKWVQAMDGEMVPYVWLPGYELNNPNYGEWMFVPNLRWVGGPRQVVFRAGFAGEHSDLWAVPSLRETSA